MFMKLTWTCPTHLVHSIKTPVDLSGTNLLVIQRVSYTDQKRATIGAHLKDSLFRQSMDFKDSWKLAQPKLERSTPNIHQIVNVRTKHFDNKFA